MGLRRSRRGLLAGSVALVALAVVFVVGAVSQWTTSVHERTLQQRGVTTAATLVRATYDPGGGDPDGWTTDTVRFPVSGHVEKVIVGHHGDARPERNSGALSVVFDPRHPAVAMSAAALKAATPGPDFDVAAVFAVVASLAAGGLLLMALRAAKRTAARR